MFGWCSDGNHATCRGKYQRFIINEKRTKRNPARVIMLDEWNECDCSCHTPEDVVDSSTTKPKRKKEDDDGN